MLRILRQRNFALLWTGGLISMTGDWVLIVGLPVEIYRRTGSTLATAGMVLAFLVPSVALGSVAGVFVDRWDRRRLMIVVDLLLALGLLPLMAVDSLGIWVAYVVLALSSSLEQLFQPAEVALLPNLLEGGEDQLVTANALGGMNRHLSRIVGPAIGGVAVAAGGLTAITIIDAASFVIAALLITGIRTQRSRPHREPPLEQAALSAWERLAHEWREGLRVVVQHPVLRALLVFFVITRIGEGLTMTLFVPWATDALHSDAAGYGWLLSTQAVGGLAGAVVIGRLGPRVNPMQLLIGGALAFGLIDLVLFTYPVLYPFIGPALVGMVIVGVPGAAMMAGIATLQQTQTADRHRGRVIGAIGAVGALGSLVGAIGAGLLGEVVPVIPLLVVQGSGYVIGSLVVASMTRGRRFTASQQPEPG
jgi:predicted MFS family arabinose efflux permease